MLTAVPAGPDPLAARVAAAQAACGWDLEVAETVAELTRSDRGGDLGAAALGPPRLVPARGSVPAAWPVSLSNA